jgi:hypothetical protein
LREAERKIAAPRRPAWRNAYAGMYGAAAMAACVTVVLVLNRPPVSAPVAQGGVSVVNAAPSAPVEIRPLAQVAAVTPVTASPSASSSSFDAQHVLAADILAVARTSREAEIAANDREAFEWMQRVDLLPVARVVVDDQAFEARPMLQPENNRVFRSRHSLQGNTEFTAFQFQR